MLFKQHLYDHGMLVGVDGRVEGCEQQDGAHSGFAAARVPTVGGELPQRAATSLGAWVISLLDDDLSSDSEVS